jgi:hypothetical protein
MRGQFQKTNSENAQGSTCGIGFGPCPAKTKTENSYFARVRLTKTMLNYRRPPPKGSDYYPIHLQNDMMFFLDDDNQQFRDNRMQLLRTPNILCYTGIQPSV